MKIEKLNENQIRCTLTREDLISRKLKLSELAYGTEKAKSLFREMMQQATFEFGFEANDIPLMIEAIPLSTDSIILIITKVEDPEELDTRFAKFAPAEQEPEPAGTSLKLEGADDILNLFQKIRDAHKAMMQKNEQEADGGEEAQPEEEPELTRIYAFAGLDDVIRAASVIHESYQGQNTLYKNPQSGEYLLFMSKSQHTPEEFNRICNMISEYGENRKYTAGSAAYLLEHGERIAGDDAVQKLGALR